MSIKHYYASVVALGSTDKFSVVDWVATGRFSPLAYPAIMGVASITWGLGVAEHVIGDGLWQRMSDALRQEPHMHLRDPDGLRRFVGACFLVLRQGCTWAELAGLVPSADG